MCATLRCVIRTSNSSKTYINRWLKTLILLSFYGIYSRHLEEPMEVGKQTEFTDELKPFFIIVRHNRRNLLNYYYCIYIYLTEL